MQWYLGRAAVLFVVVSLAASGHAAEDLPGDAPVGATDMSGSSSRRAKQEAPVEHVPRQHNIQVSSVVDHTAPTTLPSRADLTSDHVQLFVRRITVGASLVIAFALALLLLVQKSRPGGRGASSSASLKLLSTLTIAPRCCVSLVQARNVTILVARDGSGVKNMIVLPDSFQTHLDDEQLTATAMPDLMQA